MAMHINIYYKKKPFKNDHQIYFVFIFSSLYGDRFYCPHQTEAIRITIVTFYIVLVDLILIDSNFMIQKEKEMEIKTKSKRETRKGCVFI